MESIIGIIKDRYIFKGEEYSTLNLRDLLDKLNKNRKIIIFDENILIKKYKFEGKNLEKFIDDKIKDEFSNREELLFHYEYIKKENIVFLYSTKNILSKELYKNVRTLEINPIQFWIKNYLCKNYKIKDYLAILKFNNNYYLIDVAQGIVVNSFLYSHLDELKKKINEDNKNKIIVIDSLVSELKFNKDFIVGKAGEVLYEKIYKK
ncbi:hypothetical protein [Clostridium isatidis]|uniref:hypothetical protein n=1 Tax=Clostridium isatidis TaxID=182773 RepID=UPI003AB0C428